MKSEPSKRVEEELEARIDTINAAPDPDNDEHRNQTGLKEDVEDDEIERAEHTNHERLQHQEGNDIFGQAVLDRANAGNQGNWRQQRCQQDQQDRHAVHAHLVLNALEPVHFFDQLVPTGRLIETQEHHDRDQERGDREQQTGIHDALVFAAIGPNLRTGEHLDQQDQDRTDQWRKRHRRENCEIH